MKAFVFLPNTYNKGEQECMRSDWWAQEGAGDFICIVILYSVQL